MIFFVFRFRLTLSLVYKQRELGVTHIVNAAAGHCKALFADEFIYLNLELKDVPQQSLADSTQFANRFIGDALDNYRNAVVAVHCLAGVSRSVAIILSYLLECRQMRLDRAFEYMRSRRCTLSPNEGFVRQLIDKEIKQFGKASISPHSIWLPMPGRVFFFFRVFFFCFFVMLLFPVSWFTCDKQLFSNDRTIVLRRY